MKTKSRIGKRFSVLVAALILCVAATVFAAPLKAKADTPQYAGNYLEPYRPQLGYTAQGWNNDPNGLVYVPDASGTGGTYHMYYQYYPRGNKWGDMYWGHATSTDLVKWTDKGIAIEPLFAGNALYKADADWDNNGNLLAVREPKGDANVPTGTIFSGSVVYVSDRTHKTGFEYHDDGFYAIFTQPKSAEERVYEFEQGLSELNTDQRQTIAYSTDGNSFAHETFKEIIPNDYEGYEGRDYPVDFRDPKVFWNADYEYTVEGEDAPRQGLWMMVVGGGEVIQFVSYDLENWTYIGSTGYWGECPDLFPLANPDGDGQTWALVMSPKKEAQSVAYNGEADYPGEYYVLGSLNGDGVFEAYAGEELKKFSYGFDSYAGQTFTGAPDGKRYGISWGAEWATVDGYAKDGGGLDLRSKWNGGMTMPYELKLVETDDGLTLASAPVAGFTSLRDGDALYSENAVTLGESNVLQNVKANVAEVDITLDVSDAAAQTVTFKTAMSAYEETVLTFDLETMTLTVDRSRSSVAAKNAARYRVPYAIPVTPIDGKVRLRAFVDVSGINLFVNGCRAHTATFASLYSNGFSLTADGDITAKVDVYKLKSIWNNDAAKTSFDGYFVSAVDTDLHVGETLPVLVGSWNSAFTTSSLMCSSDNEQVATVAKNAADGMFTVTAVGVGTAHVTVGNKTFAVTVHSGAVDSDIAFTDAYAGVWVRDGGLVGTAPKDKDGNPKDGFIFTAEEYADFRLSLVASTTDAAAFGVVFGISQDYRDFACANYDYNGRLTKIWYGSGVDPELYAYLGLRRGDPVRFDVTVSGGVVTVTINGAVMLEESVAFTEGRIGLNVFGGSVTFDDIRLTRMFGAGDTVKVPVSSAAFTVRNVTDMMYLPASAYVVENGELTLNDAYLATLSSGKTYTFTIMSESGAATEFTVRTPAGVSVFDSYRVVEKGNALQLALDMGLRTLQGVTLDGEDVAYTFADSMLTLDNAVLARLSVGDHVLRLVTDRGVTTYVFGFAVVPPPPVDRSGMIVSIIGAALVACLLVGFVVYWIVAGKKRSKQ